MKRLRNKVQHFPDLQKRLVGIAILLLFVFFPGHAEADLAEHIEQCAQ
jgi:hypothetical protein